MNERISISATVDRDAMADEVQHFNKALADNLSRAFDLTAPGAPKMFANNIFVRLDVEDLYKVFIDALDERTAAEYDCSCCRSFVRRFLSTAILDTATGEIVHTLFPQAAQVEDRFKPGADAVQARLSKAGVIGVFPTKDLAHGHRILGVKQAGGFSHFHFAVDDATARRLIGFTTATNPEAPPLFKWDNEEDRYPYAAYVLHKPVPVDAHGPELTAELALTGRAEIAVVSNMAERMNGQPGLLGFLVNGRQVSGGSGIFPENLRADLKEVDHVIDLHSKQDRLTGVEDSCVALWLSGKVIGVLADGSEEHLTLVEAE